MSQPLPPEIITPEGQRAFLNPYTNTYSIRSEAYYKRIMRGYSRGARQQAARGHIPGQEAEQRRLFRETFGSRALFRLRYGFSYDYWLSLRRRWIDDLNRRLSPSQQITPTLIAAELQNAPLLGQMTGISGKAFVETRLNAKLYAIEQYQDYRNPIPGRVEYDLRDSFRPVEWWWYH